MARLRSCEQLPRPGPSLPGWGMFSPDLRVSLGSSGRNFLALAGPRGRSGRGAPKRGGPGGVAGRRKMTGPPSESEDRRSHHHGGLQASLYRYHDDNWIPSPLERTNVCTVPNERFQPDPGKCPGRAGHWTNVRAGPGRPGLSGSRVAGRRPPATLPTLPVSATGGKRVRGRGHSEAPRGRPATPRPLGIRSFKLALGGDAGWHRGGPQPTSRPRDNDKRWVASLGWAARQMQD